MTVPIRAAAASVAPVPDRERAERLLAGLVAIPSVSSSEGEAARWLADRMPELGFERAGVDEAGNVIGEIGERDAPRLVLLLGHIDTVPGAIPVRVASGAHGRPSLFGRGAVDAKGPLCALACGAARFGGAAARERGLRIVVAGAVEEEVPGSRGAGFLASRFDGATDRRPSYCVIGEPSRWDRVTLGYEGTVVVEIEAERPMSHGAGPQRGIACVAIDVWLALERFAAAHNAGRVRLFEQLHPALRAIATTSDGLVERVCANLGCRLPEGFEVAELAAELASAVEAACASRPSWSGSLERASDELVICGTGHAARCRLRLYGHERAYRAPATGPLPAAFRDAIRRVGEETAAPASARFVHKTGTSDMNVVAPIFECPILAYGPGDSALDHTPDEHLELDEYWRSVRVVETALARL